MPPLSFLILLLGSMLACAAGKFERLGVPVTKAMLMSTIVGPDASGEKERLYFNFAQTGATLFLVVVDPESGEAKQYKSPVGPGAWAMIRGPDDKIYLGTWESGYILKFDPKEEAKGIQVIGKPSQTETYIWQYAIGKDGKLYGCTYGNAKLISFDPATGRMEDLGRMDETQMYTRSVASGPSGKIYTAVGYGKANLVVYDPATRQHKSILPAQYRSEASASVHQGADGQVYVHCGSQAFRAEDESLVPIEAAQVVPPKSLALKDGRVVQVGEITATTGSYKIVGKDGAAVSRTFQYQGDGSILFVLGPGPDGKVYGSTAMPLEMFSFDPAGKRSVHLGNPTSVNGELYSILPWRDQLVVCAYPGSYLSIYDPKKPFKFGTQPGDNPRGFGNLGDGHLRPRAMILGPDEKVYIGSLPPYGQLGGAMAVFDPLAGKILANYRNLVTNQSIVALAYEPGTGLIFGGSSVAGGGGTTPSEKEAKVFAFDPRKREKIFEAALEPGANNYNGICVTSNKVFITTSDKLLVVDPSTRAVLHKIQLPGAAVEISLGAHPSGLIYGLTSRGVYALDPAENKLKFHETSPAPVRCGFVLDQQSVYFGSGPELWAFHF